MRKPKAKPSVRIPKAEPELSAAEVRRFTKGAARRSGPRDSPKKRAEANERMVVYVPKALKRALQARALEEDRSLSDLVTELLQPGT